MIYTFANVIYKYNVIVERGNTSYTGPKRNQHPQAAWFPNPIELNMRQETETEYTCGRNANLSRVMYQNWGLW